MAEDLFFQRGYLLFESDAEKSILTEGVRSKTQEHSISERSKSAKDAEIKKSRKTEKIEENKI